MFGDGPFRVVCGRQGDVVGKRAACGGLEGVVVEGLKVVERGAKGGVRFRARLRVRRGVFELSPPVRVPRHGL